MDKQSMTQLFCPYCNSNGLVSARRLTSSGYHSRGKCQVCGYAYDSEVVAADVADDLSCEFSQPDAAGAED